MERFNITLQNENGTTIYFDLIINSVTVATNLSAAPGENTSFDARREGELDFNIPGTQNILINMTTCVVGGGIQVSLAFLRADPRGPWQASDNHRARVNRSPGINRLPNPFNHTARQPRVAC